MPPLFEVLALFAVLPVLVPLLPVESASWSCPPLSLVRSSPLPPLCASPLESELPSPDSLWCPDVEELDPAVEPAEPLPPPWDLPLS